MAAPAKTFREVPARRSRFKGKKLQVWVSRLLLLLFCAAFLLPLYWMIVTALKSDQELALFPPLSLIHI